MLRSHAWRLGCKRADNTACELMRVTCRAHCPLHAAAPLANDITQHNPDVLFFNHVCVDPDAGVSRQCKLRTLGRCATRDRAAHVNSTQFRACGEQLQQPPVWWWLWPAPACASATTKALFHTQATATLKPQEHHLILALGRWTAASLWAVKALVRPASCLQDELQGVSSA